MGLINYYYLSNASIVLGVIAIIMCLFSDIQEPLRTVIIISMPIILMVNHCSLIAIENFHKQNL